MIEVIKTVKVQNTLVNHDLSKISFSIHFIIDNSESKRIISDT